MNYIFGYSNNIQWAHVLKNNDNVKYFGWENSYEIKQLWESSIKLENEIDIYDSEHTYYIISEKIGKLLSSNDIVTVNIGFTLFLENKNTFRTLSIENIINK